MWGLSVTLISLNSQFLVVAGMILPVQAMVLLQFLVAMLTCNVARLVGTHGGADLAGGTRSA
jgi:hypothetical protein